MDMKEMQKRKLEALRLLNDSGLQNKIIANMPYMAEDFMSPLMKERYAMGEIDEWANAEGEFGRTPTNPILVNRTWGEITYLSRLLTKDNQRMIFNRVGSIENLIDAFELVSVDGKFFDVLYMDMYHHTCSKKAPAGYTLLERLDGITGTSEHNPDFPNHLLDTLYKAANSKFGAPIVSPEVTKIKLEEARKTIEMARHGNNLEGKILGKMII